MQKKDSGKSTSRQDEVHHHYSDASTSRKSSSSGSSGTRRFGSQISVMVPPKSPVYLSRPSSSSSSSNEENNQIKTENLLYLTYPSLQYDQLMNQYSFCCDYLEDWSKEVDVLSQENAALRLVNQYLKQQIDLSSDISVNHDKNQSSHYISSKFPSVSINEDFGKLIIEDNGGSSGPNSNTSRVFPSREAPVTSPTSVFGRFDKEDSQITTDNRRYEKLMDQFRLCCDSLDNLAKQVDILSQEKASLLLVNEDLIVQLNQSTEISSGFPSLSVVNNFLTHSIGDNGGSTTTKNNNRAIPPITSPTSLRDNTNQLRFRVSSTPLVPGIMVGHGSTGFAFLNPEIVLVATDGKETGNTYSRRPDNTWNPIPTGVYTIYNSEKIFILGDGPRRIIAGCAGSTWWFKRIIQELKDMIVLGQQLTPEICADFSHGYMLTNPEDPDLPEGFDIHQEHCEILFGGFIDAANDTTRPEIQWPSTPSLFLADDTNSYEIHAESRTFSPEEMQTKNHWNFGTIGSGSGAAFDILERCDMHLVMEGVSWRSQFLRALFAMRAAIFDDEDTAGRVSIAMITRTNGFRHDHYESVSFVPGEWGILRGAIKQLLIDSIQDGSVRILSSRLKNKVNRRKLKWTNKKGRPIKIKRYMKRTVILGMH